jgi:hypothetical protein
VALEFGEQLIPFGLEMLRRNSKPQFLRFEKLFVSSHQVTSATIDCSICE